MFTIDELRQISNRHFQVLNSSAYCVTVRSFLTGHDWHIIVQEYDRHRTFQIYHRHNPTDAFHVHGHKGSFKSALRDIRDHDKFQMNGRKRGSAR